MIDLRSKPFYLSDEDIAWVEATKPDFPWMRRSASCLSICSGAIRMRKLRGGLTRTDLGFRYNNLPAEDLYHQNEVIQRCSRVPALIAANVESGGNGAVTGGTRLGDPVAIGLPAVRKMPITWDTTAVKRRRPSAVTGPLLLSWISTKIGATAWYPTGASAVMRIWCLRWEKEYMRGAGDAGLASLHETFPG